MMHHHLPRVRTALLITTIALLLALFASVVVYVVARMCVAPARVPHCPEGFLPRIIWTYWEGGASPAAAACWARWQLLNPGWTCIRVTKDTARHYAPELARWPATAVSPAHRSDAVRLCTVARYGGVWTDASNFPTQGLDWLEQLLPGPGGGSEFVGFRMDSWTRLPTSPVLENWFFAAVRGSAFMARWRDAVLGSQGAESILQESVEKGVDLQGINENLRVYLSSHVAAQIVMQADPSLVKGMRTFSAEEGPTHYLATNGWDSQVALEALAGGTCELRCPFFKMRGSERQTLDKRPDLLDAIAARSRDEGCRSAGIPTPEPQ